MAEMPWQRIHEIFNFNFNLNFYSINHVFTTILHITNCLFVLLIQIKIQNQRFNISSEVRVNVIIIQKVKDVLLGNSKLFHFILKVCTGMERRYELILL